MSSRESSVVVTPNSNIQPAFHHKAIYQNRCSYSLQGSQQLSSHSNNLFSPPQETWQPNISYTMITPGTQPPDNILTTHDTMSPAVTAPWSPLDAAIAAAAAGATTWNYTSGLESFENNPDVSNYTQWCAVEQSENPWPSSSSLLSSTQNTTMPPQVQYESFLAYKHPEVTQSQSFAEMGMTAEMSYYPTAAQIMETPIHPAFVTNVEALRQAVATTNIPDSVMLNSQQAIGVVNPSAQFRSDPYSHHASSHRLVAKTKQAPRGGRVGPLTSSQREKVEDMRNYGACWRCRKYKKPVCLCPPFHMNITESFLV